MTELSADQVVDHEGHDDGEVQRQPDGCGGGDGIARGLLHHGVLRGGLNEKEEDEAYLVAVEGKVGGMTDDEQ